MKLFKDKTVVGLFDSDHALERAITRLEGSGIGGQDGEGDLFVLDRARLAQTNPAVEDAGNRTGPPPLSGAETPEELVGNTFTPFLSRRGAPVSVEEASREALEDAGLSRKEAHFVAANVGKGARALVVKINRKRAAEAWSVMEVASARAAAA